ncbi:MULTISPECIES: hypothetical protein [unclassified Rathayibacter]|uniref:hypothetical protein n=1 Tax=unclassified Rathayibacter TaxID=2609250 RepID=UPI00188C8241|nr:MULTISPECIES: hypothetical protein [unclassified Rathayibacter]MBF4461309.1 hypothetical protein [Rathayibacter sp. VKM Ac-2879]MBF4502720.1 hypothetical protein [Rathayibacter sp. VKM Ac-2878]
MQRRTRHSLRSIAFASLATAACAVAALGGAAPANAADGEITYTLYRSDNPTADEQDAYNRITAAVDAAIAVYNDNSDITKHLNVYYAPGVPTAEASNNGDLRFGSDRNYMVQGTAMHEISHTIGVGQNGGWFAHCVNGVWDGPNATALVKSFDGPDAQLNCGGGHIWPYGLNYSNEFSDVAFVRHVDVVEAMLTDGM